MRLPALEKNILVYRALQMTLFLFYAEDLRRQIVQSVGRLVREQDKKVNGGKLLKASLARLERDGAITRGEGEELQELLEHRNKIAHEIHLLTGDIEIPGRRSRIRKSRSLEYNYAALETLQKWHRGLQLRLRPRYILALSFDAVLFEAAEDAYCKELAALEKRIDRQLTIRRKSVEALQSRPNRSNSTRSKGRPTER